MAPAGRPISFNGVARARKSEGQDRRPHCRLVARKLGSVPIIGQIFESPFIAPFVSPPLLRLCVSPVQRDPPPAAECEMQRAPPDRPGIFKRVSRAEKSQVGREIRCMAEISARGRPTHTLYKENI